MDNFFSLAPADKKKEHKERKLQIRTSNLTQSALEAFNIAKTASPDTSPLSSARSDASDTPTAETEHKVIAHSRTPLLKGKDIHSQAFVQGGLFTPLPQIATNPAKEEYDSGLLQARISLQLQMVKAYLLSIQNTSTPDEALKKATATLEEAAKLWQQLPEDQRKTAEAIGTQIQKLQKMLVNKDYSELLSEQDNIDSPEFTP